MSCKLAIQITSDQSTKNWLAVFPRMSTKLQEAFKGHPEKILVVQNGNLYGINNDEDIETVDRYVDCVDYIVLIGDKTNAKLDRVLRGASVPRVVVMSEPGHPDDCLEADADKVADIIKEHQTKNN